VTQQDDRLDPAVEAASAGPDRRLRRLAGAVLTIAIVVGVFWFFLPQFADLGAVWRSIRGMTWLQGVTLAIAAALNLASYGWVMTATMPGLTYRQAMVVAESSTAVANTLPGGAAMGVATSCAMYASWGFSRSRMTVSLLLSGLWNNVAKLGLPVVALACLAVTGGASTARLIAAAAGIAGLLAAAGVLALVLHSEAAAVRLGQLAGRVATAVRRPLRLGPVLGWEHATATFRRRTVLLLQARWLRLTLVTLASHLLLFSVLLLSLRHVGVSQDEVAWAEVLAVFAFARLVTVVPLTPGGVGIVELALVAGLVTAGGPRVEVVAGVLVFRALTYVLPIPLGVGTWVFWRRNRSWRRPPGAAPRTDLVPEA
jgi:putative heme transporter